MQLTEPTLNDWQMVDATARVTMRDGREFFLCNAPDEIRAAIDAGKAFHAHSVVGSKPQPITINPVHVATVAYVR